MTSKRCAQQWSRWMSKMKTKWIVVGLGFAGYWGTGDTVSEALTNAEWLKTKDTVTLYLCSEDAHVEPAGHVFGTLIRRVGIGRVMHRQNKPMLNLIVE